MSNTTLGTTHRPTFQGIAARNIIPLPMIRKRPLPLELCLVQAIVAYEWLVSGLNGLMAPHFGNQLHAMLSQAAQGHSGNWLTALLWRLVLPNYRLFARLIPWSEALIGGILMLSAALWLVYPRVRTYALASWLVLLALIAALLICQIYGLLAGGALPWMNPASAMRVGADLAVLPPLIMLMLLWAHARLLRQHALAVRSNRQRAQSLRLIRPTICLPEQQQPQLHAA